MGSGSTSLVQTVVSSVLAQCLTLCLLEKKVGTQSVMLEMKILKLTLYDLLKLYSSLATIVVSSTDF